MLIKNRYILITPKENEELPLGWKTSTDVIDYGMYFNFAICNHNNSYRNCKQELCEVLDMVIINDYEVWNNEKIINTSRKMPEKLDVIYNFLKDNDIKHCFELKIKEVKKIWQNNN